MIPAMNIVAWSKNAPWAEQRQIEQDLIISRALVELFNDPFLVKQLRFRGGTALNKLHFPKPLRYSEDIDLVKTAEGPLKPLLDRVHDILDPWLGDPVFGRSQVAPKFKYSIEAEDRTSKAPIRLKLEINTHECDAFDGARLLPFKVSNPWFSGETKIATFSNEELLSTKIRALLQRNKGRDLIDLSHALDVFPDLDTQKTIDLMGRYLELSETPITRPQAEQRMFAKLGRGSFLADVIPLLTADEAAKFDDDAGRRAFANVFNKLIQLMPGKVWASTPRMIEEFGLQDLITA
ncbi:nucleotidyl transferase AbiEii/AbiGii toxin family protein [Bradyrhizobium manausense]|jgi:predicted nucleotidyltransferase component of viral defense system|nr:nucleotidyl transferase AbiEii/AbiGii toxin family protein [Bradyrhizobium manausense]